ncbi:MAG TPA: hypothetical protein VOA87_05335 [Thermoanaerobaculia bacterium]|nr:hypothetical protein [Thermoanaerobaculia bacterium]
MSRSRIQANRWVLLMGLLGCVVLAGGTVTAARAADSGKHELQLTAFAVNLGVTPDLRSPRPATAIVEIAIDRWSTEAERDELIATLRTKGQDGLLKALQENPSVGTIRTPDTLAWDLHFARQTPTADGGRRIFLATNRRISFWEAAHLPRSIHYPFTLIEIHLDKNGHGEGKMSIATKIEISKDGKEIQLEDYATQPARLQDVHETR